MWGTVFLFLDTSFDEGTENGGRKAEQALPLVFMLCKNASPPAPAMVYNGVTSETSLC